MASGAVRGSCLHVLRQRDSARLLHDILGWEEEAGAETDIGSGVEVRAAPTPACQVIGPKRALVIDLAIDRPSAALQEEATPCRFRPIITSRHQEMRRT